MNNMSAKISDSFTLTALSKGFESKTLNLEAIFFKYSNLLPVIFVIEPKDTR